MFSRVKTTLLAALALIVLSSAAPRAADRRPLSGVVAGVLGGGEYLVAEALTVPAGDTLRIGAGAALYFEQLTGIDVLGVLSVSGAPGRPVVMTSSNDTAGAERAPQPFDWNGVRVFGPGAAVFMSHADVGNSVYGVNVGDTLSRAELREVVFRNNGYASVVRGGEIVPVEEGAPVSAAWNADGAPPPAKPVKPVKPDKPAKRADVKFIVNVSALSVAAAGVAAYCVGLSNTSVYYKHYAAGGAAGRLSGYYEGKIQKNITVSAVGAVAAGVGLGCAGVTLFF